MSAINPILQLLPDTYNDSGYVSSADLSRAYQTEASWLTTTVTQMTYALGGDYGTVNFPMLALTEGAGKMKSVDNFEYKYPIMGKPKLTSIIAKAPYATTTKLGIAGSTFKIYFADRWFFNQQMLTLAPNGNQITQLRVQSDPVQVGNVYEYEVSLVASSAADYVLGSEIGVGTILAGGVAKAAIEDSDGVESRSQLGGVATNMTSFVRTTTKVKGNVQNKVMKYTIKLDGKGTFNGYMDWNLFMADIMFKNACEEDLWNSVYSKYNTGQFSTIDKATGKPVTSGAGIRQQITNSSTYSTLSYTKLATIIRDVTFSTGAKSANIVMWTGTGGTEAFNDAMMDKLKAFGFTVSSDKFVAGQNSYDMVFGSFFKTFKHQDGHTVTIMKHPMFDYGQLSNIVNFHPTSGLPLTSYDFIFVDQSTYNDVANVQYVYEKGREYQQYVINGNIQIAGRGTSDFRASAKDSASIQASKSQGIQIMNTSACFKLLCTAS